MEYVRTGPQVEYATTGLLVRYVCMNRTTSRGSNNSITGKVRMYVCMNRTTNKVRMYEQDY